VLLTQRAEAFSQRTAIIDSRGHHSYQELIQAADTLADELLGMSSDLSESRVALLTRADFAYVSAQWGIWKAGGLCVPLCTTHPLAEWEYVLKDCEPAAIVYTAEFSEALEPLKAKFPMLRWIHWEPRGVEYHPQRALPALNDTRRALMLYTSGTTGRPKGVVSTHGNIRAQIDTLIEAWAWSESDRILHVLPLHHTHGIINVLCCALGSGACVEMPGKFDTPQIWDRLASSELTLFMAVPTIYSKLAQAYETFTDVRRSELTKHVRRLRLMVSGSAALPVPLFQRWREITGQELLERYGMTEIGMALSNPLRGARKPGTVGLPLPGVEVRLMDGEIQVRGATVFREYWNRPQATAEAFTPDGWFRTGDIATVDEQGYYRILGRASVDIIKTGGYKVSALEIEDLLRESPELADCAVVGIEDPEWGERVAAAVLPRDPKGFETSRVEAWARERMARYKVPTRWKIVEQLPRNAMGKVLKPELKRWF